MHIHSTYSYDGKSSVQEIRETAKSRGYTFALFAEHSEGFDHGKMRDLVNECRELSDEEMILVPGLEIDCDFGRHVLALGVKECIVSEKPDLVLEEIKEKGGIAVLPHPVIYRFRSFFTNIQHLDGVEIWNSRYDGGAPNPKVFDLLQTLRDENEAVYAFGGQDLHDVAEMDDLCLALDLEYINECEILAKLKKGAFQIQRRRTVIDSHGSITRSQRLFFDLSSSVRMALHKKNSKWVNE